MTLDCDIYRPNSRGELIKIKTIKADDIFEREFGGMKIHFLSDKPETGQLSELDVE